MKLLDAYREYDAKTVFDTLKQLDQAVSILNKELPCPEIVYETSDFSDISMENMSTEVSVPVKKTPSGKNFTISVDIGSLRMFEAEVSKREAVFWIGGQIVYTRESLNATLLGMLIVSDLFTSGVTLHVPVTIDASRYRGEFGNLISVIYTELIRTQFRSGGRTISIADLLDPNVDDQIKGLHTSELSALVLKAQVLCTLDLLDSYDIYVGDISCETILISRMHRRPSFRNEDVNTFKSIVYVLSTGEEHELPNIGYFIRIADGHTIAHDGVLIYRGFLDRSEGSEGEYMPRESRDAHVSTHRYKNIRDRLFDGDTRPFHEIIKSLMPRIITLSAARRSKRTKTLIIKSQPKGTSELDHR